MKHDTIFASFIVALFSSFLTALGVILVKLVAISVIRHGMVNEMIINLFILFLLAGFVFFKGSSIAAWLLYRHDVAWGYKLEYAKVFPIFFLSIGMAASIFFAIYFFVTSEVPALAYLEHTSRFLQ